MASVSPIAPPDPALLAVSPATLPPSSTSTARTATPPAMTLTSPPSTTVCPPRKAWWKTARKHCSNGRLSLAVGLLAFGLAIYAFIAPYALARASLAVAQKANNITLWKDCRDREDLRDTDLCKKYLKAPLSSVVKRYASEMWNSSASTRIRSMQPRGASHLLSSSTFGGTFVWLWTSLNVSAALLRVAVTVSQPEPCQLATGYITTSGAIVWLAACLNALAASGLLALVPNPSSRTLAVLVLLAKQLLVSWLLWQLLCRAARYSGSSILGTPSRYEKSARASVYGRDGSLVLDILHHLDKIAPCARQYSHSNIAILAGIGAIAVGLFRCFSPLAHSTEWIEIFDWRVWAWILSAKLAWICYVGLVEAIAGLDKAHQASLDEEAALVERDERRAREVLETEFDPLYEAVIGIRRVFVGEIWGSKASQHHPPAYLKKIL